MDATLLFLSLPFIALILVLLVEFGYWLIARIGPYPDATEEEERAPELPIREPDTTLRRRFFRRVKPRRRTWSERSG